VNTGTDLSFCEHEILMQHFYEFFVNTEINWADLWSFYETGILIQEVGLDRIFLNHGINVKR